VSGEATGVAIARVLARAGITHVFGIPGGYTIKLFEGLLAEPSITPVLAPHEQTAACMADMYGRLTGRPGVLVGQGAFIGGSGAFGIMEAAASGTPMVVLADLTDNGLAQHAATQSVAGEHGSVDLPSILRAMTKSVTVAATPNEAVHGVELALHHATRGRGGPAAVLLKLAAAYGQTDPTGKPALHELPRFAQSFAAHPDPAAVAQVAALLSKAERPVIVAGNGIHAAAAYEALGSLAHRAATPVVTTQRARGVIADAHPWAAGPLGQYGSQAAHEVLRSADTVVVLGSRLNPADTMVEAPSLLRPGQQTLVQVDVVAEQLGRTYPVSVAVQSDLGVFLEQLLPAVGVHEDLVDRRWTGLEATRLACAEGPVGPRTPMSPQRAVAILDEVAPVDTRVVLDAGNNRIFCYRYLRRRAAGRIHLGGGMLGMGWGPAAALAAAMLRPGEPVISVVGDGGMLMSLHSLAFAAEHRLAVTFVVFDNGVLGNVADFQRGAQVGVRLPAVDFAAVAAAIGLDSHRVTEERALAAALGTALDAPGPSLISVAVDAGASSRSLRVRLPGRSETTDR
jgi:acetolactate synthase I/II/III large subunit